MLYKCGDLRWDDSLDLPPQAVIKAATNWWGAKDEEKIFSDFFFVSSTFQNVTHIQRNNEDY